MQLLNQRNLAPMQECREHKDDCNSFNPFGWRELDVIVRTSRTHSQTSAVCPVESGPAAHPFPSRRLAGCSAPPSSTGHLLGFDLRGRLCFLKELEIGGLPLQEDQAGEADRVAEVVAEEGEAHKSPLMGAAEGVAGLRGQRKNEREGEEDTCDWGEEGALQHQV